VPASAEAGALTEEADVAEPATTQEMKMTRIGQIALVAGLMAALALVLGYAFGPGAETASAKSEIYEFRSTPTTTQAGGHPNVVTEFTVGTRFTEEPLADCACNDPKDIIVHSPPGVIANPHVATICTTTEASLYECSPDSQVGLMTIKFLSNYVFLPIYRTIPPNDQGGMFLFLAPLGGAPQYMTINARTDSDFGLDIATVGIQHAVPLDFYAPIFWGVPGDHANDILRFNPHENFVFCFSNPLTRVAEGVMPGDCFPTINNETVLAPKDPVSTSIPIKPMLQNPTVCRGPLESSLETLAYDNERDFASDEWPETTGCDLLSFNPSLSANPTTTATDTPSGLGVKLVAPQLQDPTTPSPSQLRSSVVEMPEGFSINPNAADGKDVCSDAEARLGTREPAQCPEFSKVGTVVLDSSALPAPIPGYIYLGEPKPGDPYRLLLTAFGYGTAIKIPGSVQPDPQTGRLTVAFDNLPEAPFQLFEMHFFGAERGLLATPPMCGTFGVSSDFKPWNDFLSDQSSTQFFVLSQGPNGQSCPDGSRPFGPDVEAGAEDNTAGVHSPLTVRMSRADGHQNLSSIDVQLPPGLLATLKGIPYCPESAVAKVKSASHTGQAEAASAACPAASLIGTAVTAEGAGSKPLYTGGKVYLAGPFSGAPLSLVVVVPAISGPYDLGNVAVRVALNVNPVTAQVTAVSDPIPQVLEGIPLRLRQILIKLDRPRFILNPTDCSRFQLEATGHGSEGAASVAAAHFQVANCLDLDFGPKLNLRLRGKSTRAAHPALRATLTTQDGEANLRRTVVTMPPTVLLDNSHIRNVCSRVLYAADRCPAASVYGRARVFTPLLDEPLEGPVYLRTSARKLPDLVARLDGQIDIEVAARISSVKGGLRTTFTGLPDAPVSKFVLNMQGGRKGLLQNSDGVCSRRSRAKVRMVGQNNLANTRRVRLRAACGESAKRSSRHHGRAGR
jgi:hypothetical protein